MEIKKNLQKLTPSQTHRDMAMDLSNRETAARAYELGDCYRAFVYYCKCFTYVTKTHANLTTYSRKKQNDNGTIMFEIDIMKKS